jgi:hypothetical protein
MMQRKALTGAQRYALAVGLHPHAPNQIGRAVSLL